MAVINTLPQPAILGAGIKTIHLDNVTFSECIEQIFSYANSANGGRLLFIGFWFNNGISADRIRITTSVPANSGETLQYNNSEIIKENTFLTGGEGQFSICRPSAILGYSTNIVNEIRFDFISTTVKNGYATLLLKRNWETDGSTYTATISGMDTELNISNNTLIQTYYNDVDVLNLPIGHLVIEYQTSN